MIRPVYKTVIFCIWPLISSKDWQLYMGKSGRDYSDF